MSEEIIPKERNLDFSSCSYIGEIYRVIKSELELPAWCRENLDALWDAITGIMYTPAKITIKRIIRRTELQSSVDEIIAVFQKAEKRFREITVIVK